MLQPQPTDRYLGLVSVKTTSKTPSSFLAVDLAGGPLLAPHPSTPSSESGSHTSAQGLQSPTLRSLKNFFPDKAHPYAEKKNLKVYLSGQSPESNSSASMERA
ncbi:hypothetical protein PoB_000782700 [Plakobranchus ocellatus]|uniref:Uncharacterized protein n=1 Tax=Plakobranchus ocellatus TaxID=259542 RepID=A0AAV3YGH2_9GAST|nr:hypothetical protein PoB_000782700 [Plakobranchus ocellatus]